LSVRGRLRKNVGSRHCSDDNFSGVPLIEVRGCVIESELSLEGFLVDQVLHLETIIFPRSKSSNLLIVVSLELIPFSFILVSNVGEIAWVNLGGVNLTLDLGNLCFSFADACLNQRNGSLDLSVALLDVLALAAVLTVVGVLVGGLKFGS